jgi:hypothetical protein
MGRKTPDEVLFRNVEGKDSQIISDGKGYPSMVHLFHALSNCNKLYYELQTNKSLCLGCDFLFDVTSLVCEFRI